MDYLKIRIPEEFFEEVSKRIRITVGEKCTAGAAAADVKERLAEVRKRIISVVRKYHVDMYDDHTLRMIDVSVPQGLYTYGFRWVRVSPGVMRLCFGALFRMDGEKGFFYLLPDCPERIGMPAVETEDICCTNTGESVAGYMFSTQIDVLTHLVNSIEQKAGAVFRLIVGVTGEPSVDVEELPQPPSTIR